MPRKDALSVSAQDAPPPQTKKQKEPQTRKDALSAQDAPPPDYFVNSRVWEKADVCEFLNVCEEIVDYLMEYEELPYVRMSSNPNAIGRTIRFSEYRVKRWFWERHNK